MSENNALTLTKDDARAIGMPTGSEWQAMLKIGMDLVGTGFLPKTIQNKEQAAAIMLKGMELRVPPMQALSNIVMVQGKPSVGSELMLALIYRDHGKQALRVKHTDAESCTVEYRIEGWEGTQTLTFTIDDAKKAGLLTRGQYQKGPGPWELYPAVMLRWRAISQVAKMAFPETIGGMYVAGELGENVRVEGGNIVSDDAQYERTEPTPFIRETARTEPEPVTDKQLGFMKALFKELLDDTGALLFTKNGHTNAASVDARIRIYTNGAETLETLSKRAAGDLIEWAQTQGQAQVKTGAPAVNTGLRMQIHRVMQNERLIAKWYPEDTAPLPFVNQETGELHAQEPQAPVSDDEPPVDDPIIIDADFEPAPEPKSGRGPDDNTETDTKQLLRDFFASKSPQDGKYLWESVPEPDQKRWLINQAKTQEELDTLRSLFALNKDFRDYNAEFMAKLKSFKEQQKTIS